MGYGDEHKIKSDYTRFAEMMERYSSYGDWHIRCYGPQQSHDVLVATLKGTKGRVEVWGGTIHRSEVWFVGGGVTVLTGSSSDHFTLGWMPDAIEQACDLAGIQRRLDI